MIETIGTLLIGILVILVIIAANGYFVAQEFAYMSVDRVKLGAKAAAGDKASQRALAVTKRNSFMLSGAQLGITITGLLVGYVAEPLVGESLGVLLGGVGVPMAVSVTVGTVLALVAATIVQMIFGELFPKNLAIANPEPLARWLARSTTVYLAVFGWLISIFDASAKTCCFQAAALSNPCTDSRTFECAQRSTRLRIHSQTIDERAARPAVRELFPLDVRPGILRTFSPTWTFFEQRQ